MKKFEFNFKQLSLEDQKLVYKHLFPQSDSHDKIDQAGSLEEITALFDELENKDVYPLAYLTAMLAHGIAHVEATPISNYGKDYFTMDVHLDADYELGNGFDIEWYSGLNTHGKGVISLFETVDLYDLEEIVELFKKYSFVS
jgi:hypothetical protein